MANNVSSKLKKRKGSLIKIENTEKEYFCIFCGERAEWTALFDAGRGAKLIERYCPKCADLHVDSEEYQ